VASGFAVAALALLAMLVLGFSFVVILAARFFTRRVEERGA